MDDNVDEEANNFQGCVASGCCLDFVWFFASFSLALLVLLIIKACIWKVNPLTEPTLLPGKPAPINQLKSLIVYVSGALMLPMVRLWKSSFLWYYPIYLGSVQIICNQGRGRNREKCLCLCLGRDKVTSMMLDKWKADVFFCSNASAFMCRGDGHFTSAHFVFSFTVILIPSSEFVL